jgi:PAS domain S-box-containing protein
MSEGVYLVGLKDFKIKYTNPKFEEIFKYSPGEMIGKEVSIVNVPVPGKTPKQVRDEIIENIKKEEEWHGEIENIKKDGTHFWSYANVSLFDHPEYGKVIVSVHTDITEKKKAEEALKESERKHRTLINNIPGMIYRGKPNWSIDFITSPETICGYSHIELGTLKTSWQDIIHPDDKEKILQETAKLNKKPSSIIQEYRIIRKDGKISWVSDHKSSFFTEKDVFDGVDGIVFDITDNKLVEDNLKESEEKLRKIIDSSPNSISITDLNGILIDCNQKTIEIHGFKSKDDIIGINTFEFVHKSSINQAMKNNEKLMKEGYVYSTINLLRKDGSFFPAELFLSLIKDDLGNPVNLIGITVDISERVKAEKELKQAHKMLKSINKELERKVKQRTLQVEQLLTQKDEFIQQLGHDLKNPLGPLIQLLPLFEEICNDSKYDDMLEVLIRNTSYMKNLVQKTIELAQLGSPTTKFNFKKSNLLNEITKVIENNKFVLDENKISVENNVDKDIEINVDKLHFHELITNILNNSIKYTDGPGIIQINANPVDDYVNIAIKDSGIGIKKDALSHIFEEFYKADQSRHDFDSSGLGLPICKRIVQRHGGDIWVESEGIGKGTTFLFTIPKYIKNKKIVVKEV